MCASVSDSVCVFRCTQYTVKVCFCVSLSLSDCFAVCVCLSVLSVCSSLTWFLQKCAPGSGIDFYGLTCFLKDKWALVSQTRAHSERLLLSTRLSHFNFGFLNGIPNLLVVLLLTNAFFCLNLRWILSRLEKRPKLKFHSKTSDQKIRYYLP